MSTRIYLVTDVETNKHRLIRAGNQAQAIRARRTDPLRHRGRWPGRSGEPADQWHSGRAGWRWCHGGHF